MMFEYTNLPTLTESLNPKQWEQLYPELEIFKKHLIAEPGRQLEMSSRQIDLQQGYQQLAISLFSLCTVLFVNILLDQNPESSEIRIQTGPAFLVICAFLSLAGIRQAKKSLAKLKKIDEVERNGTLNDYQQFREWKIEENSLLYAFFAIAGIYVELQKIQCSLDEQDLLEYAEQTTKLQRVLQLVKITIPEFSTTESTNELLDQIENIKSYIIFILESDTFHSIPFPRCKDIQKQSMIIEIIGELANTHLDINAPKLFDEDYIDYGVEYIKRALINYYRHHERKAPVSAPALNPLRLIQFINKELEERIALKRSVELEVTDSCTTPKRVTSLYSYLSRNSVTYLTSDFRDRPTR